MNQNRNYYTIFIVLMKYFVTCLSKLFIYICCKHILEFLHQSAVRDIEIILIRNKLFQELQLF